MTTFDDRERAFENRFAHDQELAFRARSRRNRRVGLWAAEHLGLHGPEGEAYAASVLVAALEGGGSTAVVRKLLADFQAARVPVSEHQIEREMETVLAQVAEALKAE